MRTKINLRHCPGSSHPRLVHQTDDDDDDAGNVKSHPILV